VFSWQFCLGAVSQTRLSVQQESLRTATTCEAHDALIPKSFHQSDRLGRCCGQPQLSLAWLLQKEGGIIPIPGTTRTEHLHDDLGAVNVRLDASILERLDALINQDTVRGSRYSAQHNAEVDTDNFA
jgi:aryl-alcohol dehydrogenase-like predicted oxidoreductase